MLRTTSSGFLIPHINKSLVRRRGLISEEEWLRIKDLPPARGGGAQDRGPRLQSTPAAKPGLHSSGDPSDCPFRKSYPNVLMMQSSQDWNGDGDTGPLDCSMQGRIFL
jgi:hypothetical protein